MTSRLGRFLLHPLVFISLMAPALGEDRMILGPRQLEQDPKGAVLCIWSLFLQVRAQAAICKLERKPVDDAMDKAILEMDEFILANSSLHPTRTMFDDFKRRMGDVGNLGRLPSKTVCETAEKFRRKSPDQIEELVKALLATPREPVMNPCL